MSKMKINIVLIKDGKIPEYKTIGSAGADCYSRVDEILKPQEIKKIPLGFAVEIPMGYEMQIRGRSGMSSEGHFGILGTIDSDYRGEVCAIIHNDSGEYFKINKGDRVAQAIIAPVITAQFNEVINLSETKRGKGGFGSTGKN